MASSMIMRSAQTNDRPRILEIWKEAFGDNDDVINNIIDSFADYENVYVAEDEGQVVAQLLAVPCERGSYKGAYLYALATASPKRGSGIMRNLMDYAKEQVSEKGGEFFILIPGSASLFDYYDALDFETSYMNYLEFDVKDYRSNLPNHSGGIRDIKSGDIPVDLFMDIRYKHFGENLVRFSEERTALGLNEEWFYECSSVYTDDGYAIYLTKGDILFVLELAAGDDILGSGLIDSAIKMTKCRTVKITLPDNSELFADQSSIPMPSSGKISKLKRTKQAQYKWWGKGAAPDFYIRFALDDLPCRVLENSADRF